MARRVLIVGHPEALGMELLGIHDIVWQAHEVARRRGLPAAYTIELGTHDGRPIRLAGNLELGPARALAECRGPVDTLVVVGGPEAEAAAEIDAWSARCVDSQTGHDGWSACAPAPSSSPRPACSTGAAREVAAMGVMYVRREAVRHHGDQVGLDVIPRQFTSELVKTRTDCRTCAS